MSDKKGMKCLCGNAAVETHVNIDGFKIKAWKCESCHEEYLDSAEAQFLLLMKKMQKKPHTAKVGVLGDSYIIRIPKEIVDYMQIKKGEKTRISLAGPHEILVSVNV